MSTLHPPPPGTDLVILSGWNDGKIRGFTPESGKLLYEIDNAHNKGVTAVATTFSRDEVISGGGEGEVRLWSIGERTCKLKDAMKEQHKGKNDFLCKVNSFRFFPIYP